MAGKEKTTEGTAALARPISQTTLAKVEENKQRQTVNDVKFIAATAAKGSLPAWDIQRIREEYKPSQAAIEFAQSWDQMPQWARDKWFSENKDALATKVKMQKNAWAVQSPQIKQVALSNAKGAVGDRSLRWDKAFIDNPDVALAAAKALNDGAINHKQMTVINDAVTLVDTISKIAQSVSETHRQEIFGRLSRPQQMAVIAISDAMVQEWQQKVADAAEEAQTNIGRAKAAGAGAIEAIWGVTGSKLFDGLIWANEQAQHLYRSSVLAGDEQISILDAWRDTSTGMIKKEEYDKLVAQYGELNVNVVRDTLQSMGDPEGFSNLVEKYQGNEAALGIIDQIILSDERTPMIDELLHKTDNITRDDLGNMVAGVVDRFTPGDLASNRPLWDLIDKGTNFAAVWFGDPTLIAGKGIKAFRIMKYGIARNFGVGNLGSMLDRPEVARLFDELSDDIIALNDMPVVADQAKKRAEINFKFKRLGVTNDAIDSLSDFMKAVGFGAENRLGAATGSVSGYKFSPLYGSVRAAWRGWVAESEGIEKLISGKAARTSNVLIPHVSTARLKFINRRLEMKKAINFDGSDWEFIRTLSGSIPAFNIDDALRDPEVMQVVREQQAGNMIDAFLAPASKKIIADRFGVDLSTVRLYSRGGKMGLPKKAKYDARWRDRFSVSPDAWYRRVDRWERNLEHTPNGRSINISDASDVDQIYAWARTTFSRPMALYVAEIWRSANVGQRRTILAGMFDTIAQARGITEIANNPQIREALDTIITSSMKSGEQYAVTQATLSGTLRDIDVLAAGSARAAREIMPNLDLAAQRKISALGYRIAQVIDRRKNLANEVKALAFDAGGTSKRAATEQEVLDEIAALRTSNLDLQRDLVDQLAAAENELKNLVSQLDNAVSGDPALTALAQLSSGAKGAFKSIDRKIASLEKRLLKTTGDDAAALEKQIAELKAARDRLRQQRTADYFETKKYQAIRENLKNNSDDFVKYNPAEIYGRQHALHLHQTSNRISVPNFAELQNMSAKVGVLNRIIGWTWNSKSTAATNAWSFANLAGPRYVQRAAVEDHLGFLLSGGSMSELMIGRRSARAVREARGKSTGVFGETTMKFGDLVNNNRLLGLFVKEHMNADEIRLASQLVESGSVEEIQRLVIKALARYKFTGFISRTANRKLSSLEEEALSLFAANGDEGFALIDEIGGIGRDLNNPITMSADLGLNAGRMRGDLRDLRRKQYGDWTQIEFGDANANAHILWYKMLGAVLHTDGRVGQEVFRALRNSKTIAEAREKAVPKIVEAIENGQMKTERFSIFNEPNMSAEDFARRYFDDSAWYFSAAEGEAVNTKLVNMLTRTSKSGAKYGGLYAKDATGMMIPNSRLSIDTLRTGFAASERPKFVLGRHEVGILDQKADPGLTDSAWSLMSDSLSRVSREPIFFARYVEEYRALQPLVRKYTEQGVELEAAKVMVSNLAKRRAEEVSLSFMDNPEVRSIAAFNMRNLARYFRATEDFYRRVTRLAKYNPEAIQKLNLGYGMLDHSGFVWSDENNEQYFIYPATGVVNDAMANAINALTGGSVQVSNPFAFGGKTLMLTPSADPNSWLPTFASPIAAVPIKLITAFGPFQEAESFLLGSRGVQPTTSFSALGDEVLKSVMPSHFIRFWGFLNTDERDSQRASAIKGAIQVLAYNGELDPDKVYDDTTRANLMEKVGNISAGILGLRFLLGFTLPASPELVQETGLTDEARGLGIKNLRRGYTELLTKFKGDADKATAAWFKINPRLMPFTVSTTESVKQTYPSLTVEAGTWMKENSSFVKKYPEAAVFIAPRAGEFSFGTYALAKSLGYIQGKTTADMFQEVITAKDYYQYRNVKDQYEAARASAKSSEERKLYDGVWKSVTDTMYASNPFLKTRVMSFSDKSNVGTKEMALKSLRAALKEIYSERDALITPETDRLQKMVKMFDQGMAAISPLIGKTDRYSVDQRSTYRDVLRQLLKDLAEEDFNAKALYDTVLDKLIGGE